MAVGHRPKPVWGGSQLEIKHNDEPLVSPLVSTWNEVRSKFQWNWKIPFTNASKSIPSILWKHNEEWGTFTEMALQLKTNSNGQSFIQFTSIYRVITKLMIFTIQFLGCFPMIVPIEITALLVVMFDKRPLLEVGFSLASLVLHLYGKSDQKSWLNWWDLMGFSWIIHCSYSYSTVYSNNCIYTDTRLGYSMIIDHELMNNPIEYCIIHIWI